MYPIEQILNEQDQKTKVTWALDCAEHILSYYESSFPDDKRLRDSIETGRAWVRDEVTVTDARKAAVAAHNAARDAVDTEFARTGFTPLTEGEGAEAAACAAARSVGQAVAAAHAAGHAPHAATYALKAVSFTATPDEYDQIISKEREWQYQRLLELSQKK
ncbi:putative immunity protein [Methanimicrococcus blatticola]|uniref:Imm-5-like domain-containing protein n=1 Tax=Methanimicrococcus blatticola TaxID=91560 RepID=A0A484F573_9EURY|nr:hypothetical protein [Methanimicrococcus blatticola]MBZ3935649.1 hypothetical protein [Methanimicrococcus blatticola]MCC2509291.1 hypothetical protein [Methanimicrococcus blatticola]TDQ69345.1 hypothetical protein C7391_0666 [Methanimicrococcus blatticola]